jgi:protein tyrosine phosphatase (PTP) superfamily phosphohydrolase (DUF442 family)
MFSWNWSAAAFRPRVAVRVCLLGLVAALLWEAGQVVVGDNFHAVLPGQVYRCAQPSPDDLKWAVREHGVRTVVNLRGCCADYPWYLEEARTTHRLGLAQEDLCFSSYRLPAVHEVRHLVEVFDRSEPPLLIHCRRGCDRTGLASAVYLLSQCDASLEQARRQLSWRYGHLTMGRTRHLVRFLDLYEEWLHTRGQEHSRVAFRAWTANGYCPGGCRAALAPLDFPRVLPPGGPRGLRVRARNLGLHAWQLKPEKNAGMHLGYVLIDERNQLLVHDRAGLYDAVVPPGESVEFTVVLPALREPGRYQLWIDMVDEQQCWFYQTGSEPLEWDLEVR